ncbi:MAG: hypothetical protein R3C68_08790 [Myxococcota bacterium]
MRRVFLLALMLSACTDHTLRQVRLDLILRGSCPSSTIAYDATCIASIEVQLLDANKTLLASRCTPTPNRFNNMDELADGDEMLPVLENIEPQSGVTLAFRAYQSLDRPPCTEPTEDELMLWGTSEPFDMRDATLQVVTVSLECRPGCDCAAFDDKPQQCPRVLQPGVCTPLAVRLCRRACNTPNTCYQGLLPCKNDTCSPDESGSCSICQDSSDCMCVPEPAQTCAECNTSADCEGERRCVRNIGRGEQFCADRCPPMGGSDPCPTLMSCKQLGTDFEPLP